MKTRPLQLLMVDDMQADIELFRELFRNSVPDLQFHSALGAQEALKHFEARGLPDVILLDLKMPDIDGHAFLAHLKAQTGLKHLPVVVLAASDQEEDVRKAYHGFASAYIVKPTTYEDCRRLIDTLEGFWRHVTFPSAQRDVFPRE